jgi:hypothetical protein
MQATPDGTSVAQPRRGQHVAAVAALAAALLASNPARADELSVAEVARLERGATVTRPQTLEHGDRRYVGGVTYTLIDARASELQGVLDDVRDWPRFLPRTRDAHPVGSAAGDALVEVTHGNALLQVSYTVRVHREGSIVRFWMDPSRAHGIMDVWGFFRTQPFEGGRTLVTYGILIDMGPGLLRDLFENRVRELALTVPQRVRGLLLERHRYSESSLVTEGIARY